MLSYTSACYIDEIIRMQKIVSFAFLTVSLCFFSCFKKDTGCSYSNQTVSAPISEQQVVKKYLDSVGVSATFDPSGFYYSVVGAGSGTPPSVCSKIMVSYSGQLIDGSVFDQETDALFTLGGLIPGWKQGLPHISKGGEIKLYIPPSLGYGSQPLYNNNGVVVVPANSILIFDINLVNVQ
jgi:FKBP-type peptidyl-prolyl cis-trans isomerase FkpA